ncbi:translation initiation factor IF-2 N-terminal domain-containing protein [Pseudonocardia humida]|uniref:Translation initiation factor IF-2 N-terminal domain-containing protein n=1 Tax=Pseudonocardia humida TaxID=2800819 RepID=A0ABT1A0P4_9PSEU|nr:translation initiation factor IF-2 N-terminal domain-containing protein [Pseudonocardia humida]MCO1656576.1 translation initiation factor IF-2 N-terminal domain-containing protein [Pseudonocardia humida]
MSNNEPPAGNAGGLVGVPDLPARMRVHALARAISRTSREVLAALADLGVEVRSAQSSVDRAAAERVIAALAPDAAGAAVAVAEAPEVVEVTSEAEPVAAPEPGIAEPAIPEPVAGAAPSLAPVFAPPTPLFQPPTRPSRRRRAPEPEPVLDVEPEPEDDAPVDEADTDQVDDRAGDDLDDDGTRRRRRRGRRGRGRGRGAEDGTDDGTDESDDDDEATDEAESADDAEAEDDDAADESADDADGDGGGSRRRRRRRRRRGSADDADDTADAVDPPNTVTKVRQPRRSESRDDSGSDSSDGVQSVRGSTRLEAKRQRRRDGRDAGRRRAPILTEAEFLARRESVDRTMVIRERGRRVEIGVLEDDILVEHFVADVGGGQGGTGPSMVGNIYLGRVQNVLPSMEAAFVDIGRGRNAVLYAGEVDWDAAGLGGKARRIEQALSSGDSVLVQVTKDPVGHKGARLTTQISLAGRFLVYVPSGGAAGISRKLPDVERKRLKDMLKEIVPSEAGVIIRTASEGVSHEALERDVRRLQVQWDVIKGKAEATGPNRPKAPVLLYEEPDLLIKVVRDQFNEDFTRLVVEGDDAWETLQNYVGHVAPELADRLHRHVGPSDVFAEHRIDEQLLKALDRKVWLPSGGTLVIDRTEAMTVIDVNTGKFTGSGGNLEETVTRNNLEAAEEVVRQLRLRDIGGIIVIDFIDMVLEANRDLVLRRLTECLARDRTRHQVAEVTSLGLVQMTRKRVGGGLLEHFSTPCEHCRGRGVVVNVDPAVEAPVREAGRENGKEAVRENGRGDNGRRSERENGRRSRGRNRRGDADERADRGAASVEVGAPSPIAEVAAASGLAPAPSDVVAEVEAPVLEAPVEVDADAPVSDAPAVEPATVAVEVPAGAVESGAVETAADHERSGAADPAADAVEEVVVERALVEQRNGHAPAEEAPPAAPSANGHADERNGQTRPRRRGRVTRTAGAPAPASGDAPTAAVVTVGADQASTGPAPAAAPVPPQPEPTAATRPRRARRAASRPAGPPADGPAPGEGDPV